MSKNFKATCEVCTQKNALVKFVHGVNMCSTCQSIYAHVGNRLPQVAAAVRQLDKLSELLMELGVEQVAVQVESSALKRIGELVGYAEGSEEVLIENVAHLADQVFAADEFLTNICGLLEDDIDSGDFTYESVINAMRKKSELAHPAAVAMMVSGPPMDLVKALFGVERIIGRCECDMAALQVAAKYEDVKRSLIRKEHLLSGIALLVDAQSTKPSDVITAVRQSEAIIEELQRQLGCIEPMQVLSSVAELYAAADRAAGRYHSQVEQNSLLAEQVAESEQRALAAEQIFARLREMLQADSLSNAEIPNAVAMLMDKNSEPMECTPARIISSAEQFVSPMEQFVSQRGALDSHLLDLLVDFPAIGIERIAVIREAVC